jgi:multicomponent Na+:H+ antiporter subunit B
MIGPRSWIFQVVVRFTFFIINVFAFYLLLRGHNQPGGGFIAGLASAASLILLSLAMGIEALHRLIRVDPVRMATAGLLLAILSGAAPMLGGEAFLTQFNWHLHDLPLLGELHVGTPLVFDLGVYLVVIGICAKIIFVLVKSTEGLPGLVAEEEHRYSSPVEEPIEEGHGAAEEGQHDAD